MNRIIDIQSIVLALSALTLPHLHCWPLALSINGGSVEV